MKYVNFGTKQVQNYVFNSLTLEGYVRFCVFAGLLPKEFTRQELRMDACFCTEFSDNYVNAFLSNSEVDSIHSPTYSKFVKRVRKGVYRIA